MSPHYHLSVVLDILTVRTDISHQNSNVQTTYGEGVTVTLGNKQLIFYCQQICSHLKLSTNDLDVKGEKDLFIH